MVWTCVRRDGTAADGRGGGTGNARSGGGAAGERVDGDVPSAAAVGDRGGVAHGAGHGGAGGRVEHAEVDVADEVERGQQVHGHAVGDDPQVAERVRLDVAGKDERLVVGVDHGQVAGRVRQPRVPAAHGVPVDQVEVEHAVVVHVVRGHVAAGAARLEHAELVVHVVRLDVGAAQVPGGHGELAVAGQRMEEQHAVPVVGHGRQRDPEHALLAPLEVDACNAFGQWGGGPCTETSGPPPETAPETLQRPSLLVLVGHSENRAKRSRLPGAHTHNGRRLAHPHCSLKQGQNGPKLEQSKTMFYKNPFDS